MLVNQPNSNLATNYTVYVFYTVDETMYNGNYTTSSYISGNSKKQSTMKKTIQIKSYILSSGGIIMFVLVTSFYAIGIRMLILNKINSKEE